MCWYPYVKGKIPTIVTDINIYYKCQWIVSYSKIISTNNTMYIKQMILLHKFKKCISKGKCSKIVQKFQRCKNLKSQCFLQMQQINRSRMFLPVCV